MTMLLGIRQAFITSACLNSSLRRWDVGSLQKMSLSADLAPQLNPQIEPL